MHGFGHEGKLLRPKLHSKKLQLRKKRISWLEFVVEDLHRFRGLLSCVCSAHKENLMGVRDEREREKLALKFTKAMCNSAEHKVIDNALAHSL